MESAGFALGLCAGCSNRPVRPLMRTRRRRRATQVEVRSAAYAKRGDGQSRRARGPQAAQQQQRSAQKIVRHSPRCPTYSRISTERREDIHIKRRDVEVRGAVKPARAIARGQASPAGLSRCADLENELQHHQRWHAVPNTVNSTSLFGVTWLVLSNETLEPKPLKSRIPVRENGTLDQKSASLGRWGVFMW